MEVIGFAIGFFLFLGVFAWLVDRASADTVAYKDRMRAETVRREIEAIRRAEFIGPVMPERIKEGE